MTPSGTKRHSQAAKERIKTGIPGLDNILGGGLPQGHFYLIEGDPGAGKTTIGLQFLLAGLQKGEKCLFITLSESKEELLGVAMSHGWSIEQIPILDMTPADRDLQPQAQYTVFHPSEMELADTAGTVLKQADEIKPDRVVFDSLSEFRLLARDQLRYRRQILALKRHFTGHNSTALLLDDRTGGEQDLQLQSIAHGVITMETLKPDFGATRRRLRLVKLRGSAFREGFHDYTIETGGIRVYPRVVAAEHKRGFSRGRALSGVTGLDRLLGGGLDKGTTTLLIGPAGTGKSSLGVSCAFSAAKQGESAAIFTFDETLGNLMERSKNLGTDLTNFVHSGRIHLQQVDPGEISPGAFVHRIRLLVEEHHLSVLLIDSLNGLRHAMPGEEALTVQLHELVSYLNQKGVVTLFTLAQHGFLGHMQSPVDISYLSDTVILLRYFEAQGSVKQAISVVKKRTGIHEKTLRELVFDGGRISVGLPLTEFEGVLTGVPKYRGNKKILETRSREKKASRK